MHVSEKKTTTSVAAYAALSTGAPLGAFTIERRAVGATDVLIDIAFCGVCHSDIHQVRDEWGGSIFPMVPGHEIVGHVTQIGSGVTTWKIGDTVGVGCFVDSDRTCTACTDGEEQYCAHPASFTYNGYEQDGKTPTYGGYSTHIVVDEAYVLRVPENLPLDAAAPLLCAGITTYSPLRRYGAKAGAEVGIVGLGGLGHMGVKLAKAMGARVTVFSHSPSKRDAALGLGADDFIVTDGDAWFADNAERFDLLVDTVSAPHDYNAYLNVLKRGGTMALVGIPDPSPVNAFSLVMKRRALVGSMIGGIRETQEMLDFCGAHGIVADIERIPMQKIGEAFDRTVKSDVRYRFVIDIESLKGSVTSAH
jgi:uncharacterized zinc-type alcohol dehydrogenase-like protein